MKRPGYLLLLLLIACCFIGATSTNNSKVAHKPDPNTVLLLYVGSVNGTESFTIGIHVQIDSSIGFRYEVVMERGTAVLSHIVLFYKFAKPNQSIVYNYLNKKSTLVKSGSSKSGDDNLVVIGKEGIDSFTCTHLRDANSSTLSQSDYWMSPKVPGFSLMMNVFKNLGPDMLSQAINGSIFNWGGLVKLTTVYQEGSGPGASSVLNLKEATTGLDFPASDFEVPTN